MSDSNRGERDQNLGHQLGLLTGVILACVIVAILAFSQGRSSERDSERAAYYQDVGERNEAAVCVGRIGPLFAECALEQERTARQAYQAERDLNAQRDMALWAFAVFGITTVTAGITLWALFYVRGTLIATREALEGTSNATDAMVRQNELTERAQRPWLDFEVTPLVIKSGDMWIMSAELSVKNPTAFPAHKVSAAAVGHYFAKEWPPRGSLLDDRHQVITLLEEGGGIQPLQAVFPSASTRIKLSYIKVRNPEDAFSANYGGLGIITFGISYFFKGGEGMTFKEYVIIGIPEIDETDSTIRNDGSLRMRNQFQLHLTEAT